MASLGDLLFGGDSSAEVRQQDIISGDQRRVLNNLLELLSGEVTEFDQSPELTERQGVAQEGIDDFIGGLSGINQALQESISYDPQIVDEFFQTNIRDPMMQDFQENVLPDIGRRYGGAFFGSERREADQNAQDELINALVRARSDVAMKERGRATTALSNVPGLAAVFGESANFADLEENKRQQAFNERMQLIQMLLGGSTSQTLENIALVRQGSPGLLGGFVQGVGEGAGRALGGGG